MLRVSTTTTLADLWLTPKLPEFFLKYPEMNLSIYGEDQQKDFYTKSCDVLIGTHLSGDPSLVQHFLLRSRVGLYASSAYLEEFGTPTTLEDLNHHRLIARSSFGDLPTHAINWHLAVGSGKNSPRDPFLSVHSHHSIVDLTLKGMGIASLSDMLKTPEQDQLIHILPKITSPTIDFYYIYPSNMKDDQRIISFQEYLLEQVNRGNTLKPNHT